jgi:hypothetical protein
MLNRALEPVHLTLVTDAQTDRDALQRAFGERQTNQHAPITIVTKSEIDEIAHNRLSRYSNVTAFREGHPCWRKITDAAILAEVGDTETILVDPDVYFPNYFTFEPSPEVGIYLMWQRTNCLHPPEIVRKAFDLGVPLADHTDIGVCQFDGTLDWEWIDWFVGKIGGINLPRSMHVESIVWAALAMRAGGGHLCPQTWRCWSHGIWTRLKIRANFSAATLLRRLDLSSCKCLHAGGRVKWALQAAFGNGGSQPAVRLEQPTTIASFREYRRGAHQRKIAIRAAARALGAYRILGEN